MLEEIWRCAEGSCSAESGRLQETLVEIEPWAFAVNSSSVKGKGTENKEEKQC